MICGSDGILAKPTNDNGKIANGSCGMGDEAERTSQRARRPELDGWMNGDGGVGVGLVSLNLIGFALLAVNNGRQCCYAKLPTSWTMLVAVVAVGLSMQHARISRHLLCPHESHAAVLSIDALFADLSYYLYTKAKQRQY
jgi:hypothetical protein